MILSSKEKHKKRAQRLKRRLQNKVKDFNFKVLEDLSMVGGGSMPGERISTYVIKVTSDKITAEKIEEKLRLSKNPIIVRVSKDEVILDVRTLLERDFNILVEEFQNLLK